MARNGLGLGLVGLGVILILGAIACMVMLFMPITTTTKNTGTNIKWYVLGMLVGLFGGAVSLTISGDDKYQKKNQ